MGLPSQNLIYHHNYISTGSYSGYFFAGSYNYLDNNKGDDHDHVMAGHQEESMSNSFNEATTPIATSTASRNQQHQQDHDQGWLQLSIGGSNNNNNIHRANRTVSSTTSTRSSPSTTALVELDLLNNNMSVLRPSNTILTQPPFIHQVSPSLTSMFPQLGMPDFNAFLLLQHPQANFNLGYINRPFMTPPFTPASLPSSSSYNLSTPPYHIHHRHATPNNLSPDHMRVINSPRRDNSGIWFMLQASQTQVQPYLPQISKSYLRIKDGRMTVKIILKYLANKLRLNSEFEVEIRCRGQEIEGNWTLQHVRDNIWIPQREILPPPYNVNDNLMLLHYGRRSPP